MKKKIFIIIGVIVLLLVLCGGLKFYLKYFYNPHNNKVNVKTESPLSSDKVKIEFGVSVNTISRPTDEDLFKNRSKYIIPYDGKIKDKMVPDYGENDFLITYDNKYYFSFRHYNIGRHFDHTYNFSFNTRNDTIFIKADIVGDSPMKFTRPMIDINLASKYRCNVPLDSAGDVYNGVEL